MLAILSLLLSVHLTLTTATPAFRRAPPPLLPPTSTTARCVFTSLCGTLHPPPPAQHPLPPIPPLTTPNLPLLAAPHNYILHKLALLPLPILVSLATHPRTTPPPPPLFTAPAHHLPTPSPSRVNSLFPQHMPPRTILPDFLLALSPTFPRVHHATPTPGADNDVGQPPRPRTTLHSYVRRPTETRRKRKSLHPRPTRAAMPKDGRRSGQARKKSPVDSDDEWLP